MVIHRHDEAHRIIIKHLNKGYNGSFLIIADVGTTEALQPLGVHHKRVPSWVLPDQIIALHHEDPQAARHKMRPDLMIVELVTEHRVIMILCMLN